MAENLEPIDEDSFAKQLAAEVYTAIASALEAAAATFKQDVLELFTLKKLLQWVHQFPWSLGTIGAAVVVAGLDFVRNAAAAVPSGMASGLIIAVVSQIPVGDKTRVLTEQQAMKAIAALFADGIRKLSSGSVPIELAVSYRIRNGSAFLKTARTIMGGAFDTVAGAAIVKALRLAVLGLMRVGVSIGGGIALLGLAIFVVNALRTKPDSYLKPLSQAKPRAYVTKKQFQRV